MQYSKEPVVFLLIRELDIHNHNRRMQWTSSGCIQSTEDAGDRRIVSSSLARNPRFILLLYTLVGTLIIKISSRVSIGWCFERTEASSSEIGGKRIRLWDIGIELEVDAGVEVVA